MKYLVLFAILAVIYLLWRHQRQQERSERAAPPPAPPPAAVAAPQDMVRCPVCELHLPRADAVADPQGRLFCSPAHRDAFPDPARQRTRP